MQRTWGLVGGVALAALLLLSLYYRSEVEVVRPFLRWLSEIGLWGNLLFVVAFVVIGFPFTMGYIPLAIGAGFLYGMLGGTLTISVGATLGCAVCFLLCRTVTRSWMERKLSGNPKFHTFMREVERNAWKLTFLTRLLPLPFGLVNALFALSSISFPVYLVGSFIGLLPFQLLWTHFGTTLKDLSQVDNVPFGPGQQLLMLLQLLLMVGLTLYMVRLGRNSVLVDDLPEEDEEDLEQQR
ncbi:hypothetical protein QOT17_020674 [Balamuthia mandrillaris]